MEKNLNVILLRHTFGPQDLIALAAKLCYSKAELADLMQTIEAKDQTKFIQKVMSMGHESVLEHVTFTFAIEGVSRTLLAQITRHRLANFSVQSQRYVGINDLPYIIPPRIKALGEVHVAEYERQMRQMNEWYKEWQDVLSQAYGAGESANEDARFVLPGACETRMIVTMNVRELRHFFSMRECSRAQWEIRALAKEMHRCCASIAPTLFADAGPACVRGRCPEGEKTCGHPWAKHIY